MRKLIKQLFHLAGFKIHRDLINNYPRFTLVKGFQNFGINCVFDIGANTGQFAKELRKVGYKGKIISFEPLSDAHDELIKAATNDPLWIVHPRAAIGDFDGDININISGNSVSSSILPMLDSHSNYEKSSAFVGSEKTPIFRLDTIAGNYIQEGDKYFIKIDTQGFEWQVLDGATSILANAVGIVCELSLVPLYKDQKLWMEMIERILGLGFNVWAVEPGFSSPEIGRDFQIDITFYRDNTINGNF